MKLQNNWILNRISYNFGVGIDAGVNTGFSIYDFDNKKLVEVSSVTITEAFYLLQKMLNEEKSFFVRVEDARKRKWFANKGKEALQGAGSIKRDCQIWEEFLTFYKIPFELIAPKDNTTKLKSEFFNKITGWDKKSNEHARDAAMLVFQRGKIFSK